MTSHRDARGEDVRLSREHRRALVTAASSGLGRACAEELAREGTAVFICSRNAASAASVAKEIGAAGSLGADITTAEDVERLVRVAAESLGGLDILVVNIGHPQGGTFDQMTDSDWVKAHNDILMSAVRLIRASLPLLAASSAGRIVNVTSTAMLEASAGRLFSSCYRAAVTAMAKHLAIEVAPRGITVNNIAPGNILTPYWDGSDLQAVQSMIPMGRLGRSDEVGGLCAFLCSQSASYITGQTFVIDGGVTKHIW